MAFKDAEERKAYFRKYNKEWYRRHKKRLLEMRRQRNEVLRQWLRQYKSKLVCMQCGENHPACLQFHHRDRADKSFAIGSIIGGTDISLQRIIKEIEKCDVLCGNCHAKRHWREKHTSDSWEDILEAEGETNAHRQDETDA